MYKIEFVFVVHDIIPGIERYCLDLEGNLLERMRIFRQHKERLLTLRYDKIEKYKNSDTVLFSTEVHHDDYDLFSDAGSQTTTTTTTTKSTRYSLSFMLYKTHFLYIKTLLVPQGRRGIKEKRNEKSKIYE